MFHFVSSYARSSMRMIWLEDDLALGSVTLGGIGIHRAVQLEPSAYLSSAVGCFDCLSPSIVSHNIQGYLP